jgi:hypothetical protein
MARYFYDRGVEFRFASFAEFYADIGVATVVSDDV